MIDLILNAAKIAISEDARKSASALFDFIRRSPEWQKEFCTIEASIEATTPEQAYLLGEIAVEKMTTLQYAEDSFNSFRTSYTELTTNAFQYGCGSDKSKKISVSIELNPHYVALIVKNPRGRKFNLTKCIEDQRATLSHNPNTRTGRGLLLVNEFADDLNATVDNEGVKAVFYKPAVSFRVNEVQDVVIIEMLKGVKNPSSSRRLTQLVQRFPDRNIVLDFSGYQKRGTPKTEVLSTYLDLSRILEGSGKKLVILLSSNPSSDVVSLMMLPRHLLAFSWDQALAKLDRGHLKDRVEQLVHSQIDSSHG